MFTLAILASGINFGKFLPCFFLNVFFSKIHMNYADSIVYIRNLSPLDEYRYANVAVWLDVVSCNGAHARVSFTRFL